MNLRLCVSGFFLYSMPEDIKCWWSPSVYRAFGEEPVYVPIRCSWYCNQHASGSRQSATEVWERGSVLGRQRKPEIGVAWFKARDTLGSIYWPWEPEVWERRLTRPLTARSSMIIHFEHLNQWSLFFFSFCVCAYVCFHSHKLPHSPHHLPTVLHDLLHS